MSEQLPFDSNAPRPEFLVVLGLIPPVSVEDVKQAYLEKAKAAHPDRGGTADQFVVLQNAFEQATEYAQFKAGRMKWLSRWVEQYAEQQQVIDDVQALGGKVDVEPSKALAQTIGSDFATVLDRLVGIRLEGPKVDDTILVQLRTQRRVLSGLHRLALINTKVTSLGLDQLFAFENLRHLNLTGTPVSLTNVQALLVRLDRLESINLTNAGLSWLARTRLKLANRPLEIVS